MENKGIYAIIDILEINHNHRKKGVGKNFFDQISVYLQNKGFVAL